MSVTWGNMEPSDESEVVEGGTYSDKFRWGFTSLIYTLVL